LPSGAVHKPLLKHSGAADVTTARVRSRRGRLVAAGIEEPTVVKAYRLLRALMNTAVPNLQTPWSAGTGMRAPPEFRLLVISRPPLMP
jgi:hypothetical protein